MAVSRPTSPSKPRRRAKKKARAAAAAGPGEPPPPLALDILRDWLRLHARAEERFLESQAQACLVVRILSMVDVDAVGESPPSLATPVGCSLLSYEISDDYEGPRVSFPVTLAAVQAVLEHLRRRPDSPLHPRVVADVLAHARDALRRGDRLAAVALGRPGPRAALIVGALHGQLADLLYLLDRHGLPSPGGLAYVFNGGLVDYGRHGVEVAVLVLMLKLLYPTAVFINRGSHEDEAINAEFGFLAELEDKYGATGLPALFQDVFASLPLGTVVEGLALVVHSGLPRADGADLALLRRLPRFRDVPSQPKTLHERATMDLLWATPSPQPADQRGGPINQFDTELTHKFLHATSLQAVVVSRSVPPTLDGYALAHDGMCHTVFSASNFRERAGNLGAVLEVQPSGVCVVHQYWAPPLWTFAVGGPLDERVTTRDLETVVLDAHEDLQATLHSLVAEHRLDLLEAVQRFDGQETGLVALADFLHCLQEVLGVQLDWEQHLPGLQTALLPRAAVPTLQYGEFLQAFRLECAELLVRCLRNMKRTIHDRLTELGESLEELRLRFDVNQDGRVTVDELVEGLQRLGVGLSEPQLLRVAQGLRIRGTDTVDLTRFLESISFKVTLPPEHQEVVDELATSLREEAHVVGLQGVFRKFDTDGDGFVSHAEFSAAALASLTAAGKATLFCPTRFAQIAQALDQHNNGHVDYIQFASALMPLCRQEREGDKFQQAILTTLYRHRLPLRRAFKTLDGAGTGQLPRADVRRALQVVNCLLPSTMQLAPEDVKTLVDSLEALPGGDIEYGEVLTSVAPVPPTDFDSSCESSGDLLGLGAVQLQSFTKGSATLTVCSSPLPLGASLLTAPDVDDWSHPKALRTLRGKKKAARSASRNSSPKASRPSPHSLPLRPHS